MLKTYYVIFRNAPTDERPLKLSLLAISEDPSVIGEHICPDLQARAMRNSTVYHEEKAIFLWHKGKLLLKVIADPNTTSTIYLGEEDSDLRFNDMMNFNIMFGQEELDDWLNMYSRDFPNHRRVMEDDMLYLISIPCYYIYKVSLLKEFNISRISMT